MGGCDGWLGVENRAQSGRGFPYPDEPDSLLQTSPIPQSGRMGGCDGWLGVENRAQSGRGFPDPDKPDSLLQIMATSLVGKEKYLLACFVIVPF